MMTSKDLTKIVRENLKGKKFVVAIQREPYLHHKTQDGIKVTEAAGGAHSLLDGILRKVGGLMVALGSGDADAQVVDEKNRVMVPPGEEKYTLKRIFLKKKELEGFYYGFANQTLWPLCHAVFIKPVFNAKWWVDYQHVNELFAQAILEELDGQEGFVWINDYHLSLLPLMLKNANPRLTVGAFWHIPWPTYEIFRICPWRKNILEGLLGADFIGFHRGYHVENFIECTRRDLEVLVDSEPGSITYRNHVTNVNYLPAGIDFQEVQEKLEGCAPLSKRLITKDFGFDYEKLIIGVDRIDYTKGIPERLKILDRFLEKYPEFQGKLVYLSIGAPSRVHIPAYKALNNEISDLVEKINWKYAHGTWQPVRFVNKTFTREKIFCYYHLSDVCLVTSLDDGMNLVAKEFNICNDPEKGMLVLSKFTGAAKDMKSALLINPYDIEDSVDVLYQALVMDSEEKVKRNTEMRKLLADSNIYQWGVSFISGTVR